MTEVLHRMLDDSRIHQQSLVDTLQLPHRELPDFDGNSINYWPFMRAFRNTVDSKATDDGSKLAILERKEIKSIH